MMRRGDLRRPYVTRRPGKSRRDRLRQVEAVRPQLRKWPDGEPGTGRAEEEAEVVDGIRQPARSALFVAISSPKKELFLRKWKSELQVPFVMGVGGDVGHRGRADPPRAPVWMQRGGLEWLYRLIQEPRRMWRRYLVEDPAFLGMVWKEWQTTGRK